MSTPDGESLAAAEVGTGRRGVVLVPEAGAQSMCGWWDYAAYLAQHGFHVILFDHRCTGDSACADAAADVSGNGLMRDIAAALGHLRRQGASRIVLMGGSQGASETLIAAATRPDGVAGIVVLSADELTDPLAGPPYPVTAKQAARAVRLPALFAVANGDTAVSVADTRALVASVPAARKRLYVEPASAGHGWAMLEPDAAGATRPALSSAIVAFLGSVLR